MIKALHAGIRSVSPRLAALLGDGVSKQIQAGFLNDDLSPTEKGEKAIMAFVASQDNVSTHLTTLAQEEIDEAEKECNK